MCGGNGICTRFNTVENKCAVVIVVRCISGNCFLAFVQSYGSSVKGFPDVFRSRIGLVVLIVEFFVEVADYTVDCTGLFFFQFKEVGDTAGICVTFYIVNVPVHGTVACGLVGVEVTFNKEAGYMVLQHAQITFGTGIVAGARASVEVDVAADVFVGGGIVCPNHVGVALCITPALVGHFAGSLLVFECYTVFCYGGVITAIEEQGIVCACSFGSCVGVDGDEHIKVVGIHFLTDFTKRTVVVFKVGGCCVAKLTAGTVIFVVRATFNVAHHDVVAHIAGCADLMAVAFLIQCAVEFKSVLDKTFHNTETLAEVGVRFKEVCGIGAHSLVCAVAGNGVRTVVGCPGTVARVDIDAEFVGGLCRSCQGNHGCCGSNEKLFHTPFLFKVNNK